MKFAQHLNEHCVPEWKAQYFSYKEGKKKLKKINKLEFFKKSSISNINTPKTNKRKKSSVETSTIIPPHFFSPKYSINSNNNTPNNNQGITSLRSNLSSFQLPGPALDINENYSPRSSNTNDNQKRPQNERTPLLDPISEGNISTTHELNDNIFATLKHRRSSFFNSIKSGIVGNGGGTISNDDIQLQNTFETDKQEFLNWMYDEVFKINSFYKEKEIQSINRFLLLQDQLYQYKDYREKEKLKFKQKLHQNCHHEEGEDENEDTDDSNNEEIVYNQYYLKAKHGVVNHLKRFEYPTLPRLKFLTNQNNDEENNRDYKNPEKVPSYLQAKKQLKHALMEFYRSLELLKNYQVLNKTACRKMIKKFDKNTNSSKTSEFMSFVNSQYFIISDVIDDLLIKVEQLYCEYLENGNKKSTIEKLRTKTFRSNEHSNNLFFGGLLIGCSIVLIIFSVINGFHNYTFKVKIFFQIWASFFLINLMILCFDLHFIVWNKFKINYKFIFDFHPQHSLDLKQYLLLPSISLFIASLLSYFDFENFKYNNDLPLIYLILMIVFLIFPSKVLYYKSRTWLLNTIFRLIFSGFYPVEFKDFFLGDIFCSLTYSMSNISFFICIYLRSFSKHNKCGSNQSRLMGFLTTLPSIWRFLQCFRRFADTGEWFPHLANMFKYSLGILYNMNLSLVRIDPHDATKKSVFIIFAVANSLYTSIWDIFMDWSLFQIDSKNKFLRNNLGYKQKNYYYIAMIINIILRFQWILYVIFPNNFLINFLVAFLEFLRRFIWIFFRMENEHCTNVKLLKASREIPLPYPVLNDKNLKPKHSVDKNDSVISTSKQFHGDLSILSHDQSSPPKLIRKDSIIHNEPVEDFRANEDLANETTVNVVDDNKNSLFRTISRAVTRAHIKDFQLPNKKAEKDGNNSSDDDDDDEDDDEGEENIEQSYAEDDVSVRE